MGNARDWFRSEVWDDAIAADFEERLRRARPHNRAQYLRIQGVHLSRTDDPALHTVARRLYRRVLDEHPESELEVKGALEHLARMHFEAREHAEAERMLRQLAGMIADTRSGTSGTSGTVELQLAETILSTGDPARIVEATEWLDRHELRLRGEAFGDVHFRHHLARARVARSVSAVRDAAEHSRIALDWADRTRSPFANHPDLGLAEATRAQRDELVQMIRGGRSGWRRILGRPAGMTRAHESARPIRPSHLPDGARSDRPDPPPAR